MTRHHKKILNQVKNPENIFATYIIDKSIRSLISSNTHTSIWRRHLKKCSVRNRQVTEEEKRKTDRQIYATHICYIGTCVE